ncbi:MAG: cupin domain-containing protein [Gemmatimonadota bacterium]|nr:cupin domain-containing protein [Gemmatimonadota bacterium]
MTDRNTPLATPADVAGLMDVQEGSVVSRTLVKNPGGSLTLFAFDAGEGLSEHETPHDAVVHVLQGSVEVTIAGDAHHVRMGEALHLPAAVPHALVAREALKFLLVMLRTG